MGLDPTGLY
ncbi:mille-pattes peptide 1 [Acyrthosiphon pisum]|uniref:Uncharacterized protein n=1 Tax=Acyrthosiphon pisum TaxID=7029 RepID=A0A8R1TCT6_ACYPI|nr:mille-pattes peptide 1 [Acyrthosiphon pisum]|eukprot:NP_001127959.1 mille-pattes peptide 1 [Acyrthosiphon pisum]